MNFAPTLSASVTKLTQKEDGYVVAWFKMVERKALADTKFT